MLRIKRLICLLVLLAGIKLYGQQPVQITPQLLPPYSLQISDYYGGAQPKLQLLLLNRDINQPSITVRLRMTIQGQNCLLQTKAGVQTQSFVLTSGMPYFLQPQELQSYFNANNLDFGGGYSQQEYLSTGRLPEGLYTFSFEAYEVVSGNVVSNKGFTMGWLTLADPPFLNTPANAEGVVPTNPQNLVFNWTPRHNTSPTAAYYTDYILTLTEYNDLYVGPDASFNSSPPLFIDSVQTTTYLYGPGKPQLVPGKRYAWRVQAKAKSGGVPVAMFRNNGYSEVYWFTYQNSCPMPLGITATPVGQRVTIEWQSNPQHLDYKVEYREKNNADAQWFSVVASIPRVVLTDIKPGTQYEYRIGGSCMQGLYTYSALQFFTSNGSSANAVPSCGDSTLPAAGGGSSLQTLAVGSVIRAGSFDVVVGYAAGTGSFTGMGYVKVPWLMNAKVEVRFTNITLSQDYKLLNGVIETTYDPTESGIDDIDEYIDVFTGGYGVGGVQTGLLQADTTISFTIAPLNGTPPGISVTLPTGYNAANPTYPVSITIYPQGGGAPQTVQMNKLPYTIQDKDGNIYQVGTNGTVTQVAKPGGGTLLQKTDKTKISNDKALVVFAEDANGKYAFDGWKAVYKNSSAFNREYERLALINGSGLQQSGAGGSYYVSAKAIAPGETEPVLVKVQKVAGSTIKPDSIQFVTGKGSIYPAEKINDSTYRLSLLGGPASDAQEVYAIYPQTDGKNLNLGKLLVASYGRKDYTVKVVPMQGVTVDVNALKSSIVKAYGRININVSVSIETPFAYSDWDKTGNGMEVNGSGVLSQYTSEMKNLILKYKNTVAIDKSAYYIFVLQNAEQASVTGAMPRGQRFGFVFTANASSVSRTIVHELGHGISGFEHTFDFKGFSQGSLIDNLMDYTDGEKLSKYQWDFAHDPPMVPGLFDADEDGFSANMVSMLEGELDPAPVQGNKSVILPCLPANQKWIITQLANGFMIKLMLDDIQQMKFKNKRLQGVYKSDGKYYVSGGFNVKKTYSKDGKSFLEQKSLSQHFVCWDCVKADNSVSRVLMLDIAESNRPTVVYNNIPDKYKFYTEVVEKDCSIPTTVYFIDDNGNCGTKIIGVEECKQNNLVCGTIDYKEFDDFIKKLDETSFLTDAAYLKIKQINSCILKNMTLASRANLYRLLFDNAEVAHPLSQDEGGYLDTRCNDGKDFLLVEMLKTASEQEVGWLLKANGFLFKQNGTNTNFIRFMNHNSNYEMKMRFAVELSKMLVQYKQLIDFVPSVETVTFSDGKTIQIPRASNPVYIYFENWLQGSNTFNLNGYKVDFNESTITSQQGSYMVEIYQKFSLQKIGASTPAFAIDERYSLHPFEFIKVYLAKDMSAELGLKVGDSLVIPAFMAEVINQVGDEIRSNQNFRIGTTILAFAAAAFTGGSSLSVVAAGESLTVLGAFQLASATLVMTSSIANLAIINGLNANTLTAQQMQNLANWDKFYNTVLIVDAGLNFLSAVKAVAAEIQLPTIFQGMSNPAMGKIFTPAGKVKMTPITGGSGTASVYNLSGIEGAYCGISKAGSNVTNTAAVGKMIEMTTVTKNYSAAFDGTGALSLARETMPYKELAHLRVAVETPAGLVAELRYYAPVPNTAPASTINALSIAELGYLYEVGKSPVLAYATQAALDDLEEKQNNNCTACTRYCQRFKSLLIKYPQHAVVLNKICQQADGLMLNGILNKLFSPLFKANQFLTDLGITSNDAEHIANRINKLNEYKMDAWQYLYDNHQDKAPYARLYNVCLDAFAGLDIAPRRQAVLFSDNGGFTQSTLVEYCKDLVQTGGFINFLNKPGHYEFAKAMVGHKQQPPYQVKDYCYVTDDDIIKTGTPIGSPLAQKIQDWLKYTKDHAQRQNYFQQGKDFEGHLKTQFVPGTALWTALEQELGSMVGYRILEQVYFCLPGNGLPCSNEGQYFIADFVLVKYILNPITNQQEIVNMVVIDAKLSKETALTANQQLAKNNVGKLFNVKSIVNLPQRDISGNQLPDNTFTVGTQIKLTKFLIAYSNGSSGSHYFGGIKN